MGKSVRMDSWCSSWQFHVSLPPGSSRTAFNICRLLRERVKYSRHISWQGPIKMTCLERPSVSDVNAAKLFTLPPKLREARQVSELCPTPSPLTPGSDLTSLCDAYRRLLWKLVKILEVWIVFRRESYEKIILLRIERRIDLRKGIFLQCFRIFWFIYLKRSFFLDHLSLNRF